VNVHQFFVGLLYANSVGGTFGWFLRQHLRMPIQMRAFRQSAAIAQQAIERCR
jgi:membrane protein YqaA with SNARE-associated domain